MVEQAVLIKCVGMKYRSNVGIMWDYRKIKLEREPTNKHDPNAIKVFGYAYKLCEWKHIGYTPRYFGHINDSTRLWTKYTGDFPSEFKIIDFRGNDGGWIFECLPM